VERNAEKRDFFRVVVGRHGPDNRSDGSNPFVPADERMARTMRGEGCRLGYRAPPGTVTTISRASCVAMAISAPSGE
jgi:hypothetical protein